MVAAATVSRTKDSTARTMAIRAITEDSRTKDSTARAMAIRGITEDSHRTTAAMASNRDTITRATAISKAIAVKPYGACVRRTE